MKSWMVQIEAPDGSAGDGLYVNAESADEAGALALARRRADFGEEGWIVVAATPV